MRSLSWILVGATIMMTAIVFLCPFSSMSEISLSADTSTLCQNDAAMATTENTKATTGGCVVAHLGFTKELIGTIQNQLSVFSGMVFLFLIATFIVTARALLILIQPILLRLKQHLFLYITKIKYRHEKKMRAWLALVANRSITALA